MSRPAILDLFCGEGGAAAGYQRAGWRVVGVDREARVGRHYPGGFHQGDCLDVLVRLIRGEAVDFTHADGTVEWLTLADIDAIHASPPCQGYTIATAGNLPARAKHKRLIAVTRELLQLAGRPWVIENVEQAAAEMANPVMLCGRMFQLEAHDADGEHLTLDRHRLFESSHPLTPPEHPKHRPGQVAGVYGGSRRAKRRDGETLAQVAPRDRHAARVERGGGYVPRSKAVQQHLLGIDWMTVKGMQESIPPVYAEHVGRQLLEQIRQAAA